MTGVIHEAHAGRDVEPIQHIREALGKQRQHLVLMENWHDDAEHGGPMAVRWSHPARGTRCPPEKFIGRAQGVRAAIAAAAQKTPAATTLRQPPVNPVARGWGPRWRRRPRRHSAGRALAARVHHVETTPVASEPRPW